MLFFNCTLLNLYIYVISYRPTEIKPNNVWLTHTIRVLLLLKYFLEMYSSLSSSDSVLSLESLSDSLFSKSSSILFSTFIFLVHICLLLKVFEDNTFYLL